MKRIAILLSFAFVLWSCAPDPRREASAYATRQQSDMQAQAERQSLQQDAESHELWMSHLREADAMISTLFNIAIRAAMFTMTVALVSLGIGCAFVFIGGGIAITKRNLAKPNYIPLNPITRQYPLIYMGNGMYALANPNDGSVMLLNTSNPADALKVKAAFAVQHDGLLASLVSHKPSETPSQAVEVIQ